MNSNEPVRRNLYIAAVIVALSTFFGALSVVAEVTAQVVFGGLSVGLGQLAVIAFGAELARAKAYGPETVNEILDAEAVIASAERGETPTDG